MLDVAVGEVAGFVGLAVVVVEAGERGFEVVTEDVGRRQHYWGSIGLGSL
jgi:hypothetical protein